MENLTNNKEALKQLMSVLIEDQKHLIGVAERCKDIETTREIFDYIGVLQCRWDELYQLTWK